MTSPGARSSGGWREPPWAWIASALLVCLFLAGSLALNRHCLLVGIDGAGWGLQLEYQAEMRAPFSGLGVDALQGSFNAYFPTASEYLVPYGLARLLAGALPGTASVYACYAVMELGAALLLARVMGLSRAAALATALPLPILTLPVVYGSLSPFYPLTAVNPHVAQVVAISIVVAAAFWAMEGGGLLRRLALAALPSAAIVWVAVGHTPYLTLMLPAAALYGGASVLGRPIRQAVPQLAAATLLVCLCLAIGLVDFYRGLIGYTAYGFFGSEFIRTRAGLNFASIVYGASPLGPIVIGMGLAGALLVARLDPPGRLRRFAVTHLVVTLAFQALAFGVVQLLTDYQGPSPVYFETCFWPYSVFFAALLVLRAARYALAFVDPARGREWLEPILPYGLVALAILAATSGIAWALHRDPDAAICQASRFEPMRPTAITEHLRETTALAPGRDFAGAVATIRGGEDRPTDWFKELPKDYAAWKVTGNDHRTIGLWAFRIPTLFDYSTFTPPPYYALLTRLLSNPEDRQARSVTLLTRTDPRYLQAWGVRFLVTDRASAPGREVARVPLGESVPPLRLMELPEPNLGGYSPTTILTAADFRSGLALMARPDFDPRTTAVMNSDFPVEPLVAARDARLTYERDGLRLRAESDGESLLVLPVQFSRCWVPPRDGAIRLVRADLGQLGLRFRGRIDARLVFRYSATQSACRLRDLREVTALGIGALARSASDPDGSAAGFRPR